jgi:hypothetical protein
MDGVRARLLARVSDDELADALRVFDAVRNSMTNSDAPAASING